MQVVFVALENACVNKGLGTRLSCESVDHRDLDTQCQVHFILLGSCNVGMSPRNRRRHNT